ncbi:MAG TPA: hypothetical protein VMF66_07790 [Candidatus Acidoferrum sp.]|nr:hypothetical protein [Candidatus Acidoferrum sp.]
MAAFIIEMPRDKLGPFDPQVSTTEAHLPTSWPAGIESPSEGSHQKVLEKIVRPRHATGRPSRNTEATALGDASQSRESIIDRERDPCVDDPRIYLRMGG